MWRRGLAFAGLAICAASADEPGEQAAAVVRRTMQARRIPAVSVAVAQHGVSVWSSAFGLIDQARTVPAAPDTLFELASLGKPITAVGVMLLAQRETISLDDPLTRFLAPLPTAWQPITLRQLMSHTSGLPSQMPAADRRTNQKSNPPAVTLSQLTAQPLVFQPGDGAAYSDVGFAMLGPVLAAGSHLEPEVFLHRQVLAPCGMNDTFFANEEPAGRRRATSYTLGALSGARGRLTRHAELKPLSGMATTASDLVRFGVCVQSDRLLNEASRHAMQTATRLNDGREAIVFGDPYGLGWFLADWRGHAVIEHGGRAGTWLSIFPDRELVVSVLTNLELGSGSDPATLARLVAGVFDPALQPAYLARDVATVEPALLESLHETLRRFSAGEPSSSMLPSAADPIRAQTPGQRGAWAKRLKTILRVRPLAIDLPTPARRTRLDLPVARIVHLRVETKNGSWCFSFWLRDDDKIIDIGAEWMDG